MLVDLVYNLCYVDGSIVWGGVVVVVLVGLLCGYGFDLMLYFSEMGVVVFKDI